MNYNRQAIILDAVKAYVEGYIDFEETNHEFLDPETLIRIDTRKDFAQRILNLINTDGESE